MEKHVVDSYYVNDKGEVLSYKYNKRRILKPSINHNGYKIVNLMIEGKRIGYGVHTLIAKAFIENLEKKPEVNHIDGNKLNNNVSNLEWVTGKENMRHAVDILGFKPSNMKKIIMINRNKEEKGFSSIAECAEYLIKNKVTHSKHRMVQTTIWKALNRKLKTAYKCTFKYV